jgi:hypothetical protein
VFFFSMTFNFDNEDFVRYMQFAVWARRFILFVTFMLIKMSKYQANEKDKVSFTSID